VENVKKVPVIIALVIIGLVVLAKAGILDSLMLFILAGVIPGTQYAVPSTIMLLLIMSAAWLLLFNLVSFEPRQSTKTSKKKSASSKKRLPKQRYKEI
jgi:hypothetical protein